MHRCYLIALLLTLASPGMAKPEPARQVRFLAVGEPPPFRQEVRDGVRYELEAPAGSIPPRLVMVGSGENDPEAASLRLGSISPPIAVPLGDVPLVMNRSQEDGGLEPWLKLVPPESGDFLVLLWRDAKVGTWAKARTMILPDDTVRRPAGSARIVNLSPASVRLVIGDEKLVLEAGKSLARTMAAGFDQPFQVLLSDLGGNWKPLHTGVIVQNPGERSLVLIFRADGESPRRPLKVTVQRERAPALPGATMKTP